jgi:hypothetical protein
MGGVPSLKSTIDPSSKDRGMAARKKKPSAGWSTAEGYRAIHKLFSIMLYKSVVNKNPNPVRGIMDLVLVTILQLR